MVYGGAINAIISRINVTPTAEVVPKSEVAREIIKELAAFVDKKERQKLIFGKSIWYVESDDLTDFIDELKKKYTEGE